MLHPAAPSKSDRRGALAHHHARSAQEDERRRGAPRARRRLRQRGHRRIPRGRQSQFLFLGSKHAFASRTSRHRTSYRPRSRKTSDRHRCHAMEVRLYAEDPDNNFFPSPGTIISRQVPGGPGVRLDDGVYEGWTVPNDYDPLLGKLIAWGNSREETIARLRRALEEYTVTGIKTNVGLFRRILVEPDFLRGEIHTKWLDELLRRPRPAESPADQNQPPSSASDAAAIAAAIWQANQRDGNSRLSSSSADQPSRWKQEGRREQLDRQP